MAKALIDRHGCRVIGVDTSPSMRALAVGYVASDNFLACPPEMLDVLIARGIGCDAALSIWVLQHCQKLADDIVRIARALLPGGALFVVNQFHRAVPTFERGWVDDGLDVFGLLRVAFDRAPEDRWPAQTRLRGSPVYRRGRRTGGDERPGPASRARRSPRYAKFRIGGISCWPMTAHATRERATAPCSRSRQR